jgi:catechol 2,3-dioxygenase-like lactoylglutathione lyase family enzyme
MKQTISFITLGVADLKTSRAFYRKLGWQESASSKDEIAFFQVGTTGFALFQREALAEDANVPPGGNGFPGFTLAHNVPTEAAVDSTLQEAIDAGGTLTRAGEQVAWGGYRGYFTDPDGFLWEICHNPFFPLDEQGHIHLPE